MPPPRNERECKFQIARMHSAMMIQAVTMAACLIATFVVILCIFLHD